MKTNQLSSAELEFLDKTKSLPRLDLINLQESILISIKEVKSHEVLERFRRLDNEDLLVINKTYEDTIHQLNWKLSWVNTFLKEVSFEN